MKFFEKFKYLQKNSIQKQTIQSIIGGLPENTVVANEILKLVNNSTTKIVEEVDFKNSYYVYLKDTIYLSGKEKNKTNYSRICLIAHECIHSVQSKLLQLLNFLFSNIELISFIVIIILFLCGIREVGIIYAYIATCIITSIPRIILEIDAVIKSVPLAIKYLYNKINKEELATIENVYNFQIKLLFPLFIPSLLFGKLVRIGILIIAIILM